MSSHHVVFRLLSNCKASRWFVHALRCVSGNWVRSAAASELILERGQKGRGPKGRERGCLLGGGGSQLPSQLPSPPARGSGERHKVTEWFFLHYVPPDCLCLFVLTYLQLCV